MVCWRVCGFAAGMELKSFNECVCLNKKKIGGIRAKKEMKPIERQTARANAILHGAIHNYTVVHGDIYEKAKREYFFLY